MSAKLVVELGDQPGRYLSLMEGAPATVGSGPTATWRVSEPDLAPLQLHIELRRGRTYLTPCATLPPILVNGQEITDATTLADGDRIEVGQTRLSFRCQPPDHQEEPQTASPVRAGPLDATQVMTVPSLDQLTAELQAPVGEAYHFEGRRAVIQGMTGLVADCTYPLASRELWLFGRGTEAQVRIEDGAASRQHFELSWTGDTLWLSDVGSVNGTTVNGKRVHRATPLRPSDMIAIGMTILRVDQLD
ncbi:FHA domain-containing protein [Planctomycetota bacterium]